MMISSRTHGYIDYAVGVLLIVAPWLLGFADNTAAQWVPVVLGILTIGMSAMTNYELGLMRVIPFPAHLVMDIGQAILLGASPWIFGFADRLYWPHVIIAIAEIGVVMMTSRQVSTAGTRADNLSRV